METPDELVFNIKEAVRQGRFVVSRHARRRMSERNVPLWQLEVGLEVANMIEEDLVGDPDPSILVSHFLADGSEVRVVWAWLVEDRKSLLVTVFLAE